MKVVVVTETMEECFWRHTNRTQDGHLQWEGRRGQNGTPYFQYGKRTHGGAGGQPEYSARKVAFRIRFGRDPEGYVKPGCGAKWCVLPSHMTDRKIRQRDRDAFNGIFGAIDALPELREPDGGDGERVGTPGVGVHPVQLHGADVDRERRQLDLKNRYDAYLREGIDQMAAHARAADHIVPGDDRMKLVEAHLTMALKYATLWQKDEAPEMDVSWAEEAEELIRKEMQKRKRK